MATFLEERTVSRKTPGDGMLEITKPVGEKLAPEGPTFALRTPDGEGEAELRTQACTCRGADHPHEHWFLVSPLFKALVPGNRVRLAVADRMVILTPE